MKWFKHYSNASDSVKLNQLIDELGIEGYGRYWLLIELLAEEYDGISTDFEVHFRKLSAKLQIKFSKKLETFLQKLSDFHLIEWKVTGKVYNLSAPILSELKSRDFKRARTDRASTVPKIKDKEKEKEKIKKDESAEMKAECVTKKQKEKKSPSAQDFDLEKIYEIYPRKIGKSSGLKKLASKIKSQKKFDEVLKATKNYAEFVKINKTDAQYIKHFTTFVNNYEDWVNINVEESKPQSGIRKDIITSILSRGFASLADLKQKSDITLTFEEESLIRENGGLLQLSKMSQYDVNQILSGNK